VVFWILDAESGRVIEARFVAAARERFELPVLREGPGCGEGAKVTKSQVDVVRGTITAGTQQEHLLVLANEPHVVVSKELRCIRLPDGAARAGPTRD
jgi:hypothetical protein